MIRALSTIGILLVLGAAPLTSGSDQNTAQDTNAQLLQEVRRLREALEAMVSTGARVQIVFGRLQLQEQRTATASRRLDDLRETLASVSRQATEIASRVSEIEERMRDARETPEVRANIEAALQHLKRASIQQESERQRIQNEESLAAGVLATEQARWTELNQQLEDLERILSKRP